MNTKTLIIIIVVLAVILIAGIVAIFVLPGMAQDQPAAEAPVAADSAQETLPQETDAAGEPVDPAIEDPAKETQPDAEAPAEETKGPDDSRDPTEATQKPTSGKDPTEATQKDPTQPTTGKTDPTTPTTVPTEPEGPIIPGMEEVDVPESDKVTYEEYYAMSADEQASFINSFETIEDFFAWHTEAKKEHEAGRVEIDGTTPIDLDDLNP